jgi:beta-lactamase class A
MLLAGPFLLAAAPDNPFAALERTSAGRLGIAVLDTASGAIHGHRLHERFALLSTFKLLLAAQVLAEADAGRLDLQQPLAIRPEDKVPHMPVTGAHVGSTLAIAALAEAAQVHSDNLAANLLLMRLGGPAAFTARLRNLGDSSTRLDRLEPALNRVPPGTIQDTTTPAAMAETVARYLTTDALSPRNTEMLIGLMQKTRTGQRRLRAGLPSDWRAGDKTGTVAGAAGVPNITADITIAWPSGRPPLVIAAWLETEPSPEPRPGDESILAEAGRLAARFAT